MANPPPVAGAKKRGLGCCGCGCIILAILAILFLALIVGTGYLAYSGALKFTSDKPGDVPAFDGGDDVFNTARQKASGFFHDAQNHLPATVQLSADEINTLLARDPDLVKNNIHLYVTFDNDQTRLQSSIPTGILSDGLLKGRYLNSDISFGVDFNPDTKNLNFELQDFKVGQTDVPKENLAIMQSELNPTINALLQNNPDAKKTLSHITSIRIENSQLIMESK